jgi:2-phospho-L-lactate guanylyltransferase (CobY/MobA/RfbA family)
MFVIPADIPMVSEQEINRVLEIHPPAPSMTIIPSKDKSGSNCLVLTPPLLIPLSFGPASFDRHLAIAKKKAL